MPTDQQIETEIQAKGLTAPRITPQHLEAQIAHEYYFRADQAVHATHARPAGTEMDHWPAPLKLLTICVLVMRNGFTVTGESACASPENFDAEVGRKVARQAAMNKLWPLEGYMLKSRLTAAHEATPAT